ARPLTPPEIQQLLDDNTILLQYSLDKDRSHLWMVTRNNIKHYFLPGRPEIEKAATSLGQALTAAEARKPGENGVEYMKRFILPLDYYRSSAIELSRMILGPVSSQLGNKRLVVVADGILQSVPFEVLHSPESASDSTGSPNLLLTANEIVYEPSASALAQL